jgi:hypothetical protein
MGSLYSFKIKLFKNDSSVGIARGYRLDGGNSIPGRRKSFSSSPQHPNRFLKPAQIVYTYRKWRNKNSVFDISPQEKNYKALDPDLLEVNVSVPCSGLLIGQSNVEADCDPGHFEPPFASEAELHLG